MADIDFENEITDEMYSVVAESLLYREDAEANLFKSKLCPKHWTKLDIRKVYQYIIRNEKFKQIKEDYKILESQTLVEDDLSTVMLIYNRLLRNAQEEGKYDVVARILKEIRQLKAIDNEQMKFEVVFKVMTPEEIQARFKKDK